MYYNSYIRTYSINFCYNYIPKEFRDFGLRHTTDLPEIIDNINKSWPQNKDIRFIRVLADIKEMFNNI